ncbi:transposase [Streptomyces cacaoi]|uniref:transposase n=1 Tax=Streptomyces cacaoi TaxID=1898 RepID=UPI00374A66A7
MRQERVKNHLIVDRNGLPLSLGISAANRSSSPWCEASRQSVPVEGPGADAPPSSTGDKDYDYSHLWRWLSLRQARHRITRKGIESSQRLDRHRWVVERKPSWLTGCRRLDRRYERKPEHFLAFTAIATPLICHRRVPK